VQRRHQKVLEEAPAPLLSAAKRSELGDLACAAARAVGYVGAGTVEFIVSRDGAIHFMEMNTRLQVEHPVTEMITGQDLVEWQLRVAAGEALPLRQDQLSIGGHALEARIYAEDPDREFLPSPGRLSYLRFPPSEAHVRVDTGVEQGDEITPYYDPLIAKLIVWGESRDAACARMLRALGEVRVVGVAHNLPFLSKLVASPAFAAADLDTGLIERERERLFAPAEPVSAEVLATAALGEVLREALDATQPARDPHSPWGRRDGWRLILRLTRRVSFQAGEGERTVAVKYGEAGDYGLQVENLSTRAKGSLSPDGALEAEIDGNRVSAVYVADGNKRHVFVGANHYRLVLPRRQTRAAEDTIGTSLTAPMPGKVIALLAEPGPVVRGAPLLVLEAMKMEHAINAPASGYLKRFRCAAGDQVAAGAELVDFEAAFS
jgi:3-methylcrotonyl-CoA carboxylase alpha subunit